MAGDKNASQIRDLPKNIEAEQVVLGSVILEPEETVPTLLEMLKPEHFYRLAHRVIFRAIRELFDRGEPADIVAVANRLEEKEEMENAGGRIYLNELLDRVTTTTSLEYYAGIVRKKAVLRALIEAGEKITELGYREKDDLGETIARAAKAFSTITDADVLSGNGTSTWVELQQAVSPVAWCWANWLPAGMLTLVAGEPGSGKSALALRVAATFLRGDPWPDGTPYTGERGKVIWCEAEAAQAINLSRAKSWDLPLDSLVVPSTNPLDGIALDDPTALARVTKAVNDPEVRLVVLDSLSGTHRGDENAADVVQIVLALAALARDSEKPVLLTHHLRKRSRFEGDEVTLERLRGSSAIVQPARVVWALDTPNGGQKDWRRLSVIKNNLAAFPKPLGIAINGNGVVFGEPPERPHIESQVERAADLLRSLLRIKPMASTALQKEADGAGISWETMKRAKKKLGVVAVRKDNRWLWSLPAPGEDGPPF